MGGAIKSAGAGVSSIIGGIGASKGASAQQKYLDRGMDASRQGYADAIDYLNPYNDAGKEALSNLTWMVNNPDRRAQLLYDYYRGNEFNELSNQARYQSLSAAEATGGLGSTATGYQLASIAPMLGQNYLNTTYNQLQSLAGLGANTASNLANISVDRGNTLAGLYNQKGQLMASKAMIPWQTGAAVNQSVANTFGNLFSPQSWLGGDGGSY